MKRLCGWSRAKLPRGGSRAASRGAGRGGSGRCGSSALVGLLPCKEEEEEESAGDQAAAEWPATGDEAAERLAVRDRHVRAPKGR